ncbi:MAG: hypothetical protein JXR40_04000 [Pontiellaceae bacterium]|nr:hypothetical protein [Pontiellaceae bacterium]
MKKSKLLSALKRALITEESSIKVYSQHITEIAPRSGLSDEQISQLTRVMSDLRAESVHHKEIVTALINKIKEDPRDDI